MHRWLIALFTLHFALGLGAFALGLITAPDQLTHPLTLPDAVVSAPAQAHPHGGGLPKFSLDHGLSDAQPDFPDTLQSRPLGALLAHNAIAPAAPAWLPHTPPELDRLKRPPRG